MVMLEKLIGPTGVSYVWNLDPLLSVKQCAAECEAVGIRISSSKSEAMVSCQERVACPFQFGDKLLPQVKKM